MRIKAYIGARTWCLLISAWAASLLVLYTAKAVAKDCDWQPTSSLVEKIESNLKMPNGLSIKSYERFYAGEVKKGHHIVVGEFIKSDHPGAHVMQNEKLPHVLDGGCSVVNLEYDVEQKKVVHLFCNGVG